MRPMLDDMDLRRRRKVVDLPPGINLEGETFRQPGVAMPADAREMVDDLVGRLDLPQGATRMPRLTAVSALRLAAQAEALSGRTRYRVTLT